MNHGRDRGGGPKPIQRIRHQAEARHAQRVNDDDRREHQARGGEAAPSTPRRTTLI